MRNIFTSIDWNAKLGYNTVKVVSMRDWRLGLLHYAFMALVVLYVCVFSILIQQRYLREEIPLGTIRLSLLQGQNPTPASELPYCYIPTDPNTATYNTFKNYPCLYYDAEDVVFPITEQSAMFATTRLRVKNQTVDCSFVNNAGCAFKTKSDETYYIGDIERFTLLIDHTMYTPSLGIQYNARKLKGELLDSNGKIMTVSYPSVVGSPGTPDILELGVLLKAAGFNSLDDKSGVDESASMRYDGVVLIVFIDYTNTHAYNVKDIKYTYKIHIVEQTEFKEEEPLYLASTTERVVLNRHGIRLVFLQGGNIGKFDFQVLLLSFVSGIGLVTVATTVVDFIAMNIVTEKKVYKNHKYEVTNEYKRSVRLSKYKNNTDMESSLLGNQQKQPYNIQQDDNNGDYEPPSPNPPPAKENQRESDGWNHYYHVPK